MEIIGLIAAIIGIVSGIWFFADKARDKRDDNESIETGYLKELSLEKTPLFVPNSVLTLGEVTAIIGDNGVGKTAVCEWASVLEDRTNVDRWRLLTKYLPIIYSIRFGADNASRIRIHIDENRVSFFQDGGEVPEPKSSCRFIFVKDVRFDWTEMDDLGALSRLLGINRETVKEYLSRVGKSFYCTIQKIEQRTVQHGEIDLIITMEGATPEVCFRLLSQSEKGRVVIEVAFAIGQYIAEKMPVVVVVERSFSSLDKSWMQRYVDWVLREQFKFQTIFNSIPEARDVDWSRCHVVNIEGQPPIAFIKPQKNT